MDYVDLLLDEISKAKTNKELIYIYDDIEVAKGLGDLDNKQDQRLLRVALECRYSYILFKDILGNLEKLLEGDYKDGPKLTLVKDFESSKKDLTE